MGEIEQAKTEVDRFATAVDVAAIVATAPICVHAALKYGGVVREAALSKIAFDTVQSTVAKVSGFVLDQPGQLVLEHGWAVASDQFIMATKTGKVNAGKLGTSDGKSASVAVATAATRYLTPRKWPRAWRMWLKPSAGS